MTAEPTEPAEQAEQAVPTDPTEPAGVTESSPRALYLAVADGGTLRRLGDEIESGDPSGWPGYSGQLRRAREATGARHAVTTAAATVGGEPCVLIGFEFPFLGGSMGTAEGAKIVNAFSAAIAERLPVVSVAASGGSRIQEGTSALVQMQAVAAAIAAARRAGVPHIAVAGDPTTGGVWSSLVASADVIIGVPGARVSFSGSRTRPAGSADDAADFLASGKWARGFVDLLVPAAGLRRLVAGLITLLSPRSRGGSEDRAPLPGVSLPGAPHRAGAGIAAPAVGGWEQVELARRPDPDRAGRWLAATLDHRVEIRGDRSGGVDPGLRCGFGRRDGATIAFIAQTGQPTSPAGFRTAVRLLALAERFGRPVLTLIDTPGAAATPGDEASGVGSALAELFVAMASCRVPITSVVVGEGVSGGALALASPDDLWIADGGYLAVTAPELAASILKLPAGDVPRVAGQLRLTPAELLSRGIVHGILQPPAARHHG
jgi:acetyl-CoA carboxylase beta subunit